MDKKKQIITKVYTIINKITPHNSKITCRTKKDNEKDTMGSDPACGNPGINK